MCDAIHIATMSLTAYRSGLATFGLVFPINNSWQYKPSLESFTEAFSNKHCSIKKSFHAVYEARFCFPIEFAARFVHTFFPTHIRERVNLALKLVLLIFDHELLLKLLIDLGITWCSSKRHFGSNLKLEPDARKYFARVAKWLTQGRADLGTNEVKFRSVPGLHGIRGRAGSGTGKSG